MGTLHYAVNHKSKSATELGKYSWPELEEHGPFASVEELRGLLLQVFAEEFDPSWLQNDYDLFFASELWAIGNEYQIITEHESAVPYVGYTVTNSRYVDARSRSNVGLPLTKFLDESCL